MIRTIGVDIEKVKRFKNLCKDKHFLKLIFTEEEIKYCNKKSLSYISYAGKFCCKEAIIKAYNKKILMKNIEIRNLKSGKLSVKINNRTNNRIKCSISHTDDYAIAFVVVD